MAINPASGTHSVIGPIPALAGAGSGASFTFSSFTGTAYLDLRHPGDQQALYSVNLANGASTMVGIVDHFGPGLLNIAAADMPAVPEPGTAALCGFAAAILVAWRKRARRSGENRSREA